jgi:uncharacterized membrane protein
MNEQTYYPVRGRAADFRRRAKKALKGCWWMAALVTLLAVIFGGVTLSGGVSFDSNFDVSGLNNPGYTDPELDAEYVPILTPEEAEAFEEALANFDFATMAEFFGEDYPIVALILSSFVLAFGIAFVVIFALQMFVSSPVKVGYRKFCLNVLDGKKEGIGLDVLFDRFSKGYLKTVGLNFVHTLIMGLTSIPVYVGLIVGGAQFFGALPTLLASETPEAIIIPFLSFFAIVYLGAIVSLCISIPVSYMYSMAHFIMADYPGVGAIEALRLSRQMMRGNKWRLFCLDFSFIGWILLAACCTCGIGYYFLTPYQYVSHAAFYEEISNRGTHEEVEFPSVNPEDYYLE